MLNKCILIGRLTDDPELKYTNSGKPVVNFTIAVERPFTNSEGERNSDYIDIVAWQNLAESSAKYLNKGRLVAVTGRLQISKNKNQGKSYINPEIVANVIKFLDSPNSTNSNNQNRTDTNNKGKEVINQDDIPDSFNNELEKEEDLNNEIEVPF